MIVPSSLKGVKPSSSTMGGQGHQNVPTGLGTGGPTNVSSILQNLRTPQGNPNSILSPIQHRCDLRIQQPRRVVDGTEDEPDAAVFASPDPLVVDNAYLIQCGSDSLS